MYRGFHVTSYQANSSSHHTPDHHVGFLFTRSGIGKYNKTTRYLLFLSSYHNTKLQLSDKKISTHTVSHTYDGYLNSFCEVNYKFKPFLLFSSIPRHTKLQGKIVCVWVRTRPCKPFIGPHDSKSTSTSQGTLQSTQQYWDSINKVIVYFDSPFLKSV